MERFQWYFIVIQAFILLLEFEDTIFYWKNKVSLKRVLLRYRL